MNIVNPQTKAMVTTAEQHLRAILNLAIKHTPKHTAIIVYDTQSSLAITLTEAYRRCLPTATFIDFYAVESTTVITLLKTLAPKDLVILIQSSSFRLNEFRLRVELFAQGLKVIEHPHLSRMINNEEENHYLQALAYDANYYHKAGHALKNKIDAATCARLDSGGEELLFNSPLESAKLNIGDYTDMKNIGGQFPIGEVFTEAKDLEAVSGRVRIFAFGDITFSVHKVAKPITLIIDKGRVTDTIDSIPEFDIVLANIRADEGEVWLRELGFGLNKAFSPEKTVTDIGTYERMCGVHLSLGAKHSVYKKPQFRRADVKYHVDVFAVTHAVYLDDEVVFQNGEWQV